MEGWVSITGGKENGKSMESEPTELEQSSDVSADFLLDDGGGFWSVHTGNSVFT
jgi:hypothetical protein